MALVGRLYHVGIVVPDIEAAKEHLSDLLGITWGPVLHVDAFDVRAFDRDGGDGNDLVVPNTLCYSTEPPHLELVLEVPGPVWECNEHSNLHHIGVFSTALVDESGRFSSVQCPLELTDGRGDSPPVMWAYHRDPLGVRIEIVNDELRPVMEQYMWRAPEAE